MITNTIPASIIERVDAAQALTYEAQATHSAIMNHPDRSKPELAIRFDHLIDRSSARCWRRINKWEAAVSEMAAA